MESESVAIPWRLHFPSQDSCPARKWKASAREKPGEIDNDFVIGYRTTLTPASKQRCHAVGKVKEKQEKKRQQTLQKP
jgi:hypothetical protein